MAFSHEFQRYRNVRSAQILPGIVTSILLHFTLLMGSKYWYRTFIPEPQPEIPIEAVEIFPHETHIPQKTPLRAAKDSIAGGKAVLKMPISAVKQRTDTVVALSKSPLKLKTLSPLKVMPPQPRQQKVKSPSFFPQQTKLQRTKLPSTTLSPTSKPKTTTIEPSKPVVPKVEPTALTSATRVPVIKPQIIDSAKPAAPKVEPTALTSVTKVPVIESQKTEIEPTTSSPTLAQKKQLQQLHHQYLILIT